mmetsp:Transcript_13783/g.32065  ORF Transcript_13783/g.32065 Transcript_13783/m.32065 type:complete len:85 (+) Transcript_13783:388-642(+)
MWRRESTNRRTRVHNAFSQHAPYQENFETPPFTIESGSDGFSLGRSGRTQNSPYRPQHLELMSTGSGVFGRLLLLEATTHPRWR